MGRMNSRGPRNLWAVPLVVLLAPILLLVAAANWIFTRRVLFRQVRLGRNLRPFVLLKFQTMVDGAEAASTVTVDGDPRITRFGRALRALKLDELPQLFNVLRGEMNLVGPRPLTPNEVDAIPRPLAAVVYRTTPGVTGISALTFTDEEQMLASSADPRRAYFEDVLPRKIALELAYANRRTWITDAVIVLCTPLAPFSPAVRRRVLRWLLPEWERLVGSAPTVVRRGA